MKVCQAIREKAIKFCSLDDSPLGDGNMSNQSPITFVLALVETIAIKFPEQAFAVCVVGMMNFQKVFEGSSPVFESFKTLGQGLPFFAVSDEIAADLLAFKDGGDL